MEVAHGSGERFSASTALKVVGVIEAKELQVRKVIAMGAYYVITMRLDSTQDCENIYETKEILEDIKETALTRMNGAYKTS